MTSFDLQYVSHTELPGVLACSIPEARYVRLTGLLRPLNTHSPERGLRPSYLHRELVEVSAQLREAREAGAPLGADYLVGKPEAKITAHPSSTKADSDPGEIALIPRADDDDHDDVADDDVAA